MHKISIHTLRSWLNGDDMDEITNMLQDAADDFTGDDLTVSFIIEGQDDE